MEMLKFGITIESHEECRQEPEGENTSIFKLLSGKMNFTKGNFILGRIYQKIKNKHFITWSRIYGLCKPAYRIILRIASTSTVGFWRLLKFKYYIHGSMQCPQYYIRSYRPTEVTLYHHIPINMALNMTQIL